MHCARHMLMLWVLFCRWVGYVAREMEMEMEMDMDIGSFACVAFSRC